MTRLLGVSTILSALVVLASYSAVAAPPAPTAIPEPGILAMMATGIGALLVVKFRNRK